MYLSERIMTVPVEREIVTPDMLHFDDAEQGSEAWLAARAGLVTGSCFYDVIAMSKPDKAGKQRPLASRETYLWKVVTEMINGAPLEGPSSFSLQWGHDVEPFAREAYEADTGSMVMEAGFITRKNLPGIGVSVDGLIGEAGTYESKCPKDSVVHMKTWANGMPPEHKAQTQGGLWVAGRDWCDFVSYDPRCKPEARLYIERQERDEPYIHELAYLITTFLAEVNVKVDEVKRRIIGD